MLSKKVGRRLVLINPVNRHRAGLSINPSTRFPPLGLGVVAALTPADWEITIIDENVEPFTYQEADLVGLTAFTASAMRAYEIAQCYRAQGVRTVLGGIHASMLPEEALRYVNTVVIGEAEGVWPKVIADFEVGNLQRFYQGALSDLKNIPKPRHDLFHPSYMFDSIQTSRGCPMDCDFCSVTVFNGNQYRQRPVDEVLDELEAVHKKKIFFVDDNIIGYGREATDRAVSLFKGIINRGIKKDWMCQASINFADNDEVLARAAQSGCRMVVLGIEAADIDALSDVNKKMNLQRGIDSYEKSFRRINKHGIAVVGAFIYGVDSDTPEKIRQRTDYILTSGIDVIQITALTPLPGTRLFDRLRQEGRLFYTDFPGDWVHYDMREVIHRPLRIEPQELARALAASARRLYSRRAQFFKFIKTWRTTWNLTTALWALVSNRNYRNVASSRFKRF